ncbi:hypothetical protein Len3610_15230 [Lentibacillus sp. CBA3610]|nr:hypothetical protein Len3610_15230 [Lentibacillus sp. CBA3610]
MPFITTTGLLLIIFSVFVPFPAILFIQDTLFFSYDHLSFIRPTASYVGFGAGMIWLAIVLFSFLLTKRYFEKKDRKYKLTGIHLAFLTLGFVFFAASIFHYHYLDEHGIQSNLFWSLSEESMAWDDVKELSRVVEEDSYRVLSYTFSSNDMSITIPYDAEDADTSYTINRAIDMYNWEVVDNFTAE